MTKTGDGPCLSNEVVVVKRRAIRCVDKMAFEISGIHHNRVEFVPEPRDKNHNAFRYGTYQSTNGDARVCRQNRWGVRQTVGEVCVSNHICIFFHRYLVYMCTSPLVRTIAIRIFFLMAHLFIHPHTDLSFWCSILVVVVLPYFSRTIPYHTYHTIINRT